MRAIKKYRFQAVAILLMSTGCSVSDPLVGAGSVALGPAAEKALADYQAKTHPRYFALSEDGSAFYYNYCPAVRCVRTPKSQIVRQCETYSVGVSCKIYARNGNVVWAEDD